MGVHIHIPPLMQYGGFSSKQKTFEQKKWFSLLRTPTRSTPCILPRKTTSQFWLLQRATKKIEYKEPCVSEEDCTAVSKKFYTRYLFPVVITDNKYVPGDNPDGGKEESDETWMDIEDAMYERDDELCLAMADFLAIALQEG